MLNAIFLYSATAKELSFIKNGSEKKNRKGATIFLKGSSKFAKMSTLL